MTKLNKNKIFWSYILILLIGFLIGVFVFYNNDNKADIPGLYTDVFGIKNDMKKTDGSANIVAVGSNGFGIIGKVNVDIEEGEGKILVNTNPFVEPDTQLSAITAVNVAKNITGVDLGNVNVIIDFEMPNVNTENRGIIGGPSAGTAMTLAVLSAINGKKVKNVVATGAILPDGRIGQIGGVIEKADAVADNNLTLFLIPKGQGKFAYYERQIKTVDSGNTKAKKVVLVPKTIDLVDYFKQEKNLTIKEVDHIEDVINYAF